MADGIKPSSGGWCGRDFRPRVFPQREVVICYDKCSSASVNRAEYDLKRHEALIGMKTTNLTVPKKSARTWEMLKGDLCRITVVEGPQVVKGRPGPVILFDFKRFTYMRTGLLSLLENNLPHPTATVVLEK